MGWAFDMLPWYGQELEETNGCTSKISDWQFCQ